MDLLHQFFLVKMNTTYFIETLILFAFLFIVVKVEEKIAGLRTEIADIDIKIAEKTVQIEKQQGLLASQRATIVNQRSTIAELISDRTKRDKEIKKLRKMI